jgi:hypothetical protein
MNDMRKPVAAPLAAPVFTLAPRSEKVVTENFGTVTAAEMSIPAIAKLMERYGNGKDDTRFGYALVAESVTGPHGERFTIAAIESLPARALRDFAAMAKAATRVNGLARDQVEKASPLP